ncbi:exported hypothetical protein [Nitrospira lenta]|uniref:Lipoprotein n=1 Tax=Nitrospira lenta TaxID=1436998 RepID=A0A330L201_9BACT|nr:exported hypothetical protein [Nitrospira lenta]
MRRRRDREGWVRIGLCMAVLISCGCAGAPSTSTSNLAEISRQDPCASRSQQSERTDTPGRSCRAQHVWWDDVGDALSGVATAVRFPRQ